MDELYPRRGDLLTLQRQKLILDVVN